MRPLPWFRLARNAVVALLFFAVLWKGGKTLETTWLLSAIAWGATLTWWDAVRRKETTANHSTPFGLWFVLLLFVVWTGVATVTSTTRNYGLDELLRDASLAFLLLWSVRQDALFAHRNSPMLRSLVFASFASAALGLIVYVLQPVDRFVGTFLDFRFHTDYWPNAWAQYTLLAWPMLMLWAEEGRGPRARALARAALGAFIGAFLLSYSRASLLVFAAQVAFLTLPAARAALRAQRLSLESLWRGISPVLGIAAVAILTFAVANSLRAQFHPVQSITEKVTFTAAEGGSSVSERIAFFEQALTLSAERPLTGWGPGSFRFIQPHLQDGVLRTSDHPHNVLFKYAAERGWIAVFFFLAIVLLCLWRSRVLCSLSSVLSPRSFHLLLPLVSVLGVLLHNLMDFNLQFVGIALPFWLLLGQLARHPAPLSAPAVRVPSFFIMIAEIILVTVIALVAILEAPPLLVSSFGRRAEARGENAAALELYAQATHEAFSRDLHLSRAHLLIEERRFEEAVAAIEEALRENAQDARTWRLLGDLHIARDDRSGAAQAYWQAWAYGKWNDLGILVGLLTLTEQEPLTFSKAEADAVLQAYADAILENRHFIALSSNVEAFLVAARLLARAHPDDAPRYDVLSARVDRHARTERARLRSRAPGILW